MTIHKAKDTIHKAKDNSFKLVFGDPDLFAEFLRDFIKIDILSDVTAEDIEDMTERFLPLFQDNKDSDTIKRVNLKDGNAPLFVIAILEHESQVNYRTSFKMLQYITLVLTEYEKEANKNKENASYAKDFMFPPVLPIVYFDGERKWTAATNFLDKVELSDVFYKYIPKFEYELVNLNNYDKQELIRFGDALSLILLIDKITSEDGVSMLGSLPPDYIEELRLNIPSHLHKLLADVITVLLKRINVPKSEIDVITEKIYTRRFQEMFAAFDNYDVQETRRIAKHEGVQEGIQKGIDETNSKIVLKMKKKGFADNVISEITNLPVETLHDIYSL